MGKPVASRAASIARLRPLPRGLKVSMSVVGSSIRYFKAAAPPPMTMMVARRSRALSTALRKRSISART